MTVLVVQHLGAVWSEQAGGTNTTGTALATDHPVQVFSRAARSSTTARQTTTTTRSPPGYMRSSTRNEDGYDYPHEHPTHVSPQELMPDAVIGERFYEPDALEADLRDRLQRIRKARGQEG